MLNSFIRFLYAWIPKSMQEKLGRSRILEPIRNIILHPQESFREISVPVNRNYCGYAVSFDFYASLKTAYKAENRGIENTIIRNAIQLLKQHKRIVEKEAVIFDVGANFGYLSLVWAKSIAQDGSVIAFEPNVNVHNSFKKSIQANKLSSIINLQNRAVGKKNGKIQIFLSTTTSNIVRNNASKNSVTIDMVSLDSFCEELNIGRCDLVKIDVDGIELDILNGSVNVIGKFKPIFIVETNADNKIIEFFNSQNYIILDMHLKIFQSGDSLPPNIFCVPKPL